MYQISKLEKTIDSIDEYVFLSMKLDQGDEFS